MGTFITSKKDFHLHDFNLKDLKEALNKIGISVDSIAIMDEQGEVEDFTDTFYNAVSNLSISGNVWYDQGSYWQPSDGGVDDLGVDDIVELFGHKIDINDVLSSKAYQDMDEIIFQAYLDSPEPEYEPDYSEEF